MAKISTASRDIEADAFAAQFNGGTFKMFPGTIPADPQTAEGQTEIVAITLEATAFGASSAGTISLVTPATPGTATSAATATWGRFYTSAAAAIMDVTVAISGQDLDATKVIIAVDDTVNITSFTYTIPE